MPQYIRILSIDGGGVRGIIAGQVIIAVEQKLRDRTGNPDARVADYFDLIAGTSTGGILTCIYLCPDTSSGRPKWEAKEAVDFYLAEAGRVFDVSPWQWLKSLGGILDEKYNANELEDVLHEYFGNVKLSDLLKPCLITAYDIEARHAKFFTEPLTPDKDYLVKDVLRAASAVPAHFEVPNIESLAGGNPHPLIDGGVFANNPALCAYAEVRNKFPGNPTAQNMAILSVGTGFNYNSYIYASAKGWGYIEWARPMFDIMSSGVSETVDYQLHQLFDAANASAQYLRVNGQILNASLAFDDASNGNLQLLKQEGIDISGAYDIQLDDFVQLLLP